MKEGKSLKGTAMWREVLKKLRKISLSKEAKSSNIRRNFVLLTTPLKLSRARLSNTRLKRMEVELRTRAQEMVLSVKTIFAWEESTSMEVETRIIAAEIRR